MSTPVIGICAVYERAQWGFWDQRAALVGDTYLTKIRDAGGVAVVLAPDPAVQAEPAILLDRVDALLLVGGADVDPASYGATASPSCEGTVPERDAFEIALAREALRRYLPVLGICRGMQILNVATGGTLHQHLLDNGFAEHRAAPGRLDAPTMHDVDIDPGSWTANLAGPGRQRINSHHHQGVADLGHGATVTARSVPDDLPEAIEWTENTYAVGVQWHPEAESLDHAFDELVVSTAQAQKEIR